MKFLITVFTNLPEEVAVKNVGDRLFQIQEFFEIEPKQEIVIPVGLAKTVFGDWENDSYGEQLRREKKNIHLLDVKIQTKTAEIKDSKSEADKEFEQKVAEPEFADLEETEKEVEPEVKQCVSKTKAGKPCKISAEPGSEYCKIHKPKKGDK